MVGLDLETINIFKEKFSWDVWPEKLAALDWQNTQQDGVTDPDLLVNATDF